MGVALDDTGIQGENEVRDNITVHGLSGYTYQVKAFSQVVWPSRLAKPFSRKPFSRKPKPTVNGLQQPNAADQPIIDVGKSKRWSAQARRQGAASVINLPSNKTLQPGARRAFGGC